MESRASSNSEDFRDVIDDLTIKNKKLRKKLKKYENLHCSHLQEEKLFEVRIHGLAAHKRRELEKTLRTFALSIDNACPEEPAIQTFNSSQLHPLMAGRPWKTLDNPSSPSTSISRPVDSAYASMSGQTGGSQSHLQAQTKLKPVQGSHEVQSSFQHVESYLHDIPDSLMLQHSLPMSDLSKSKVVVRRLEQIFTGRGVSRRRRQCDQQQEVSQSAAKADRSNSQSYGQRITQEGTREAHILPVSSELLADSIEDVNPSGGPSRENSPRLGEAPVCGPRSPEQRPTRPLDLDIHRAQVPSDNIEYIRRLGLASLADGTNTASTTDDGWVYLNLLTSMAQLHTLNVTPEFIRKALADVSAKFELSSDGTKVRWFGGSGGTGMGFDGDESEDHTSRKSTVPSFSTSKRSSTEEEIRRGGLGERQKRNPGLLLHDVELPTAPEIGAKRRPVTVGVSKTSDDFHYEPLFYHTARSCDNDSDLASASITTADSIGFATPKHNTTRERQSRLRGSSNSNGPIIFYNKAKFCTDLSGDLKGAGTDTTYTRYTKQPDAHLSTRDDSEDSDKEMEMDDKPANHRIIDMEIDSVDIKSNGSATDLEGLMSCVSECASEPESPRSLDASGLGGILPQDNFVIRVQVQHGPKPRPSPSKACTTFRGQATRMLHSKPQSSIDGFLQNRSADAVKHNEVRNEVISTVRTIMAPSKLPPPSLVYLPFSSSGSSEDGGDDVPSPGPTSRELLHSPIDNVGYSRDLFMGSSSRERVKESSYASSACESDDSSIDMLAHARVLDPDTILAREREFDSSSSPRLAELHSIPSATVGDGDGTGFGGGSGSYIDDGNEVDSMSVDGDNRSDVSGYR